MAQIGTSQQNLTMDEALRAFEEHLMNSKEFCRVVSFWHGFEGWLKFELSMLFCQDPWNRIPWNTHSDPWEEWEIGMEYKTQISQQNSPPFPGNAQREILVDFWVSSVPVVDPKKCFPCHYFELKTVFNNRNRNKQIRSWLEDFNSLRELRPQLQDVGGMAGCASIIFAVGWDKESWSETVSNVLGSCYPQNKAREPVLLLEPKQSCHSSQKSPFFEDGVIMHALVWTPQDA